MNLCHTCRHWQADEFRSLPPEQRSGVCDVIRKTLDFSLRVGWDGGYVEEVETPGDFGCVKHEEAHDGTD